MRTFQIPKSSRNKQFFSLIFSIFIGILLVYPVPCLADRLPSQVPENQVFSIDTLIDATGTVTEESELNWILDDQNLEFMIENAPNLDGTSWNAVWLIDFIFDYGGTMDMFEFLSIIRAYDGVEIVTVGPDDPYYDWGIPILSLKVPETLYETIITQDMPGLTFGEMLEKFEEGYHVAYAYNRLLEYDRGHIHDGKINPTEEIAILNWMDSIRTNGGKLSHWGYGLSEKFSTSCWLAGVCFPRRG